MLAQHITQQTSVARAVCTLHTGPDCWFYVCDRWITWYLHVYSCVGLDVSTILLEILVFFRSNYLSSLVLILLIFSMGKNNKRRLGFIAGNMLLLQVGHSEFMINLLCWLHSELDMAWGCLHCNLNHSSIPEAWSWDETLIPNSIISEVVRF